MSGEDSTIKRGRGRPRKQVKIILDEYNPENNTNVIPAIAQQVPYRMSAKELQYWCDIVQDVANTGALNPSTLPLCGHLVDTLARIDAIRDDIQYSLSDMISVNTRGDDVVSPRMDLLDRQKRLAMAQIKMLALSPMTMLKLSPKEEEDPADGYFTCG